MEVDYNLRDEIMKGDYRNESEDLYIKMVEKDSKKNLVLKIGLGAFYISVLIISLFVV